MRCVLPVPVRTVEEGWGAEEGLDFFAWPLLGLTLRSSSQPTLSHVLITSLVLELPPRSRGICLTPKAHWTLPPQNSPTQANPLEKGALT